MPFFGCYNYIDAYIMPYLDFLHTPTSFPLTKRATKSYFGIFLSSLMIIIFSYLVYIEIISINKNYTISYSQDFIQRMTWNGRKISIGFNVSKEFSEEVNFLLEDSNGDVVPLQRCDENLNIITNNTDEKEENATYYCITNYSLKVNYIIDYALKINVTLRNKNMERKWIPFSLAIREPKIQHDNIENPLDIYNNPSIDKFRCIFDTRDVSSFRRNLKLITYKTEGGFIGEKTTEGIYLDDFEDSRKKAYTDEDKLLIGTYRILVSKKIEVYSRKYIELKKFFSNIGGYISVLMSCFSIACKILVNPNDNYRIFDYLKKKKSIHLDVDTKSIYDDLNIENKPNFNEFNKTLMDNRWFSKCRYKFYYFFCRFFKCCKKIRSLSLVSEYIQKNLTIENYLENQILNKKLLKHMIKIDELKAQYLNIFKNRKNTVIVDDIIYGGEINAPKNERLITYESMELQDYYKKKERHSTVLIENESGSISFNEKQQKDIIKIVLRELF